MRLLLDTHIAVWFILDDPRLPRRAATLIEAADDVSMSLVSAWEAAIKRSLTRRQADPIEVSPERLLFLARLGGWRILSIAEAHIIRLERIPRLHGDPFDRMLFAQAQVEGLQLLTADERLHAYGAPVLAT